MDTGPAQVEIGSPRRLAAKSARLVVSRRDDTAWRYLSRAVLEPLTLLLPNGLNGTQPAARAAALLHIGPLGPETTSNAFCRLASMIMFSAAVLTTT